MKVGKKISERKKARKQKKLAKMTERERVEEKREEVLAQGRKFKYPLQYAKHRLVINTVIIVVVAMVLFLGAGWFMLYKSQSTNDMLYRLTRFLPVDVAQIDGEGVRYSDYLMIYRSSIIPVEQQGQLGESTDKATMEYHYKRAALTEAEDYAYTMKLARELGVTVSGEQVQEGIREHRNVGGVERSEESFLKIIRDNFGLTLPEYERMVYLSLLKLEVSKKIDDRAEQTVKEVEKMLAENGGDMLKVAESMGEKVSYERTGGLVDKMNVDGGRAVEAMKLEPGQISEKFLSSNGDGYYLVKLVAKNDKEVNYESIKVSFTELEKRIEEVRKREGAVKEYIELKNGEENTQE